MPRKRRNSKYCVAFCNVRLSLEKVRFVQNINRGREKGNLLFKDKKGILTVWTLKSNSVLRTRVVFFFLGPVNP